MPRRYENKNESEAVLSAPQGPGTHRSPGGPAGEHIGLASTPISSPGRVKDLILPAPPFLCSKIPSDIK